MCTLCYAYGERAAYEELTRGLNNADKRRLAQIVEERTVR